MVTKEEVQKVLDEVRPSLQQDGGDVELVDVKDSTVYLRLQGHCRGCPYSQMTIKNGIEQYFKKKLNPGITVVGVD